MSVLPTGRRRVVARRSSMAAAVIAALLATYFLSAGQSYLSTVIATMAVYGLAATGLDFVVGWLREVSVGQGAAMLVGAYCAEPFVAHNFLLAIVVAAASGMATGAVMGLPAIRVRGFALATYTLIAALAVQLLFTDIKAFGGGAGKPVAAGSLFGLTLDPSTLAMTSVVLLLIGIFVHYLLRRSMVGLAWRGVGQNPQAAGSISINPIAARLSAFGMAGLFAGVAGLLYAVVSGFLAPDLFPFELAVQFLAMVVIGGRGHPLGATFGAALIVAYHQYAPASAYSDAIIGGVLLLAVWLAPKGVMWYLTGRLRPLFGIVGRGGSRSSRRSSASTVESHHQADEPITEFAPGRSTS